MNQVEMQIIEWVFVGLGTSATGAIAWLASKASKFVASHVKGTNAVTANHVIAGLTNIADNVVASFNQQMVNEFKQNGMWDSNLAAHVKQLAIADIKSQSGSLTKLAEELLPDVEGIISSAIEKSVSSRKSVSVVSSVKTPVVQVTPTDVQVEHQIQQ